MSIGPKFSLSRLREIGWTRWDPIGLNGIQSCRDDEYDSYLLQAAGHLWDGRSKEEVTDFLLQVETEHMGLGEAPGVRQRARDVVSAINWYVAELRR